MPSQSLENDLQDFVQFATRRIESCTGGGNRSSNLSKNGDTKRNFWLTCVNVLSTKRLDWQNPQTKCLPMFADSWDWQSDSAS